MPRPKAARAAAVASDVTAPEGPRRGGAPLPADLVIGLHHVGVVVADLDAALARQAALGFGLAARMELPEQGVIAATVRTGTDCLELIQPLDPNGPIARFLAKRGEGLHHVAYAVPDLDAALRRLAASGVRVIDDRPRSGAHGWRIAFVHPDACNGVLTELVETPASDGGRRGE